jgi:tetratricopeptide (TPR) repeat protein
MNRRERRPAERLTGEVSAGAAPAPAALCEAGIGHMLAGRYLDAQLCAEQALAADPAHADALHLMGELSLQAQQHDQAVEWISRAIRCEPKPAYLNSLGIVLLRLGRSEDAVKAFDKAVQLKPDGAQAWRHLGYVLSDLGRSADGVLCLQHALRLDPENWSEAEKCGILLHGLGQFEEALHCFDICDRLRPNLGLTLYMRGRCLIDLQRFDEGLSLCQRAHALDPANADISLVMGLAFQALGQHDKAVAALDNAIGSRQDFVEALNAKAASLGYFRRLDEALRLIDRALKVSPSCVATLINKAFYLTGLHRSTRSRFMIGSRSSIQATPKRNGIWPSCIC